MVLEASAQSPAASGTSAVRVLVGTSGWHYAHWKSRFYPPQAPAADWLEVYARRFSAVEVNNSFYHLPESATIDGWRTATPPGFVFAVKAPRSITHLRKLRNCEAALTTFLTRLERFGRKLGPILFQLPPHWHANPRRLEDFLALLPENQRCAFELRDPDWHRDEVYAVLRARGAAFCIYDLKGFTAPLVTTADFVYLRLHGPTAAPYAGSYNETSLRDWAAKAKRWSQREGRDVYIFFDNDEAAHAVRDAQSIGKYLTEDTRSASNLTD